MENELRTSVAGPRFSSLALLAVLSFGLLAGCGQKGPLMLPAPASATPAASAAAAS